MVLIYFEMTLSNLFLLIFFNMIMGMSSFKTSSPNPCPPFSISLNMNRYRSIVLGSGSYMCQSKVFASSVFSAQPTGYIEHSTEKSKPAAAMSLAATNFGNDLKDILKEIKLYTLGNKNMNGALPESLGLTLSNAAVKRTEHFREKNGGRVEAHPVSFTLYEIGCKMLDLFFDGRPLARFWFLETIARIPYFVYVSALHLYESLGWWREPSLRKIHSAEEWNEMHHLLIMESLGANKRWIDRFLAYNSVIGYYWMLVVVYMISPRIAYQFMELLEAHAVDTYSTFIEENAERLKALPAPEIAVKYYTGKDLYDFDEFQVSRDIGTRRPSCNNLYEVFCNIRDDEIEHVHTMQACQNYAVSGVAIQSPHDK